MTWKTAKFAGRCTTCGGAVMQGDRINHDRGMGGVIVCPSCRGREGAAERATESEKAAADDRALFHALEMEGYV
jgi:DNA-directed RNA polymerase subunit RPC12/RpoP